MRFYYLLAIPNPSLFKFLGIQPFVCNLSAISSTTLMQPAISRYLPITANDKPSTTPCNGATSSLIVTPFSHVFGFFRIPPLATAAAAVAAAGPFSAVVS